MKQHVLLYFAYSYGMIIDDLYMCCPVEIYRVMLSKVRLKVTINISGNIHSFVQ